MFFCACLLCDGEVDERHRDADFWEVVRVGKLGGDVETEARVVVHISIAQVDKGSGTLQQPRAVKLALDPRKGF